MAGRGRKWQRVAVCLILVTLLLSALPGTALAAVEEKEFSATMTVDEIEEGTVWRADGRWLVRHRPVRGNISGNVTGEYELVYTGLVDDLQSGVVRGSVTITTDGDEIFGRMTVISGAVVVPYGLTLIGGGFYPVFSQDLDGTFRFVRGTGDYARIHVAGTFDGTVYPIVEVISTDPPLGHIIGFANSETPLYYYDYPSRQFIYFGDVPGDSLIELEGIMQILPK